MSEVVFLPFQQSCSIIVLSDADFLQRVTIRDLELGQTHGPFTGRGHHDQIGRFGLNTGNTGGDPRGYRVEVVIESSGDNGATFGLSRTKLFNGGPEPWTLFTVGSEDIGSSDGDFNDAYVVFNFPFALFSNDFTERLNFSFFRDNLKSLL